MRSAGKTPIAPLITDRCNVVSLSARISEGRLRPVPCPFGWVGSTATACADRGGAGDEVMKATMKSLGESHRASTRQGRRFEAVKSEKGNAAWTISPGWNMPKLFLEPRVFSSRKNIGVAVNIRFFLQKIERATFLSQTENEQAVQVSRFALGRLEDQHGETGVSGESDGGRKPQHAALLYFDRDCLHRETICGSRRLPRLLSASLGVEQQRVSSWHRLRSKRALRLEFRVYAARCGEGSEPPGGGTPSGDGVRMHPHQMISHV